MKRKTPKSDVHQMCLLAIPALQRQRRKDGGRFQSSLVYLFSKFRVSQGYIVTPCLKTKTNKDQN